MTSGHPIYFLSMDALGVLAAFDPSKFASLVYKYATTLNAITIPKSPFIIVFPIYQLQYRTGTESGNACPALPCICVPNQTVVYQYGNANNQVALNIDGTIVTATGMDFGIAYPTT